MLRMSRLIFVLVTCAFLVSAQSTSQPVAQVIRFGWSHYQQGNLGMETGIAKAGDTPPDYLKKNNERLEALKEHAPERTAEIERLEEQKRQSQRPQVKIHSQERPTNESRFKYTLEITNSGSQPTVEWQWDYVFLDPRTRQEALRYSFVSKVKIKAGKTGKLTIYTDAAPYGVVSAKDKTEQVNERVELKRIVYADGSRWEAQ